MIASKIMMLYESFRINGLLKRFFWFLLPSSFLFFLFICFQIGKPFLSLVPCIALLFLIAFNYFGTIKTLTAVSISTFFIYYVEDLPIPGFITLGPTEILIIICFLFFPLFVRKDILNFIKLIPYKKSMFLLLFSILLTSVYIFSKSNSYFGRASYGNSKVVIFILGYVLAFYLLYYNHISIKMVFNCLIAAGILFIAAIIFYYWKSGNLNGIITQRIGTDISIHPNAIAMALDMIFPIAFFSALYYKKNMIIKVMLFFFSFLFLVTLFFTYSRGSYFGLMAMGIYLFFNKIKLYKIVLFIIIIFLSFTFLYEGILYRFNKHDPAVMESNIERVALMQSAFKMIKNNYFIFGNGMLTFSLEKYDYSFPKWIDRQKGLSTHNLYLEHFVGLGLFGFLGITFILFGTFFSLVKLKVPDKDKYIKFGLLFALLSCMLHGFVDSQVGNIAYSLPLFLILASAAFLIYENKNSEIPGGAVIGNP